jgi:flavin-dependent dehydrogenase
VIEHGDGRVPEEVVIIGGSTAGLFAAYRLARAGVRVELFEQAPSLETTPRTLIVTSRMLDVLDGVGRRGVLNEVKHYELFADGHTATVTLGRPDLVIERANLAGELGGLAEGAGARVALGRRFVGLRAQGEKMSVMLKHGTSGKTEETTTGTVVGADGAFSGVARAAGWPRQRTVPLLQAVVTLPKNLAPDTARVWFMPNETPYFYWLIPESQGRGVLGLIGERGADTRRAMERFLEEQDLTAWEFQGARIPVYERWVPPMRQLSGGRVFLVGDAAGHVKVSTIGGIVTGFLGALGIVETVLNGGSSRVLRTLRRELELHRLVRRMLHRFTEADYLCLLDAMNGSARRSLNAYTRDDAAPLLVRLCFAQPRLVLMGMRALLKAGWS